MVSLDSLEAESSRTGKASPKIVFPMEANPTFVLPLTVTVLILDSSFYSCFRVYGLCDLYKYSIRVYIRISTKKAHIIYFIHKKGLLIFLIDTPVF